MLEYIEQLSNICSASGDEGKVRRYIASVVKPYVDELYTDTIGNLYAVKHGGERKIMLDAHMDEVGVVITDYRDDGTLDYTAHLSIDPRLALGKTLAVGPNELPGVFRLKHEYRNPAEGEYLGHDKLCIDIGSTSREETEKAVSLGDYACFNTKWRRMGENMMAGKAFDDRIGCAVIMELLKNDYPCDLYAVFSVQEETGVRGTTAAVMNIQPDAAIVFEGPAANDVGLSSTGVQVVCTLGKGPIVTYMDNFTIVNEKLFSLIRKTAEENGIPYQLRNGVKGGTNAYPIQTSFAGCEVGVLSVPSRYIHSPCAFENIDDYINTYKLADALLRKAMRDE